MKFKFLPLGIWHYLLLVAALTLLGMAVLLLWVGGRAGWEGFGVGEVLLITLALGAGALLFYLFASLSEMFVVVEPDGVRIKAGFLLDDTISMENIKGAEPSAHSLLEGIGVRISLSGTLAVISSTRNIVQLNLKEPQRIGFVTLRLNQAKRIKLSLEDPQAFLKAVRAQMHGGNDSP